MRDADEDRGGPRGRPYVIALTLALAVPLLMGGFVWLWGMAETRFGLRQALVVQPACAVGARVSLPSEGWRLRDGSFVLARRTVPGPDGTLLFNDSAGRARCLRPLG